MYRSFTLRMQSSKAAVKRHIQVVGIIAKGAPLLWTSDEWEITTSPMGKCLLGYCPFTVIRKLQARAFMGCSISILSISQYLLR